MRHAVNRPAIVPLPLQQPACHLLAEVECGSDPDALRRLAGSYRAAASVLADAAPVEADATVAEAFAQAYLALARRAEQRSAQAARAAGAVVVTTLPIGRAR